MTARRLLLRSVTLVLVLIGARSSFAADERAPVPEKSACAPVLAELKAEFREELAKKDTSDRKALAETLLARAADEQDPVRRYVALEQAADLAERAEDVRLTLAAYEALGKQYTTYTVGDAVKAVGDIGRGSKDVSVQAEAATACIELAGDALLLGSGDATNAAKAMSSAKSLAKKAKMDGIAARAAEIEKLVASFKRAKAAFPAVEKALAEGTDPPAALAASGRYMAFGWGEWMQGMSQLAEGDDATLRDLAKAEFAVDESPSTREALADGWWKAAQDEKDPLARARMLARAAHHYEIALQDGSAQAPDAARERLGTLTYLAWDRSIALTTDFSKYGPANLALATVRAFIEQQRIDKGKKDWRTTLPHFPEIEYAPGQEYFWRLETNHGEMTLRLFADTAPQHVTNFLYLTELGFFDGLTFHRVIPGFMAQGGDPTGSGSGGPGYFIDGEFEGGRKHADAGTLSMANTGKPRSDGSQFFITFRACPELDGKHTVFGELVDGMKVLKELESEGTPGGPPKSPLVIERATVFLR